MGIDEAIEVAGMANRGRIGNAIPAGEILVPGTIDSQELPSLDQRPAGYAIVWRLVAGNGPKFIRPPYDLVQAFADLHGAGPAAILSFAKRYGVLGIDENGHAVREVTGAEPVTQWNSVALRVRSMLHLGALIQSTSDISPEQIATINPRRADREFEHTSKGWSWNGEPFPTAKRERIEVARSILDSEIKQWLYLFPAAVTFERKKGEIELTLEFRLGLLSAVTLQLMQAVARKSLYFCSECKSPFVRAGGSNEERKPRSGAEKFCEKCGRTAAVRRADERRRDRALEARRLHAKGSTPGEIARDLKTTVKTATKWIKKGK